jgi:L-fuculose-phosphate aldolase
MSSNSRESFTHPRQILVGWLARLYRHQFTTTTGGNLSVIDDDGTLYITPSGGDKASLIQVDRDSIVASGFLLKLIFLVFTWH